MLLFLILISIHGILFCCLGKTERGRSLATKGNSGALTEGVGVMHRPLSEECSLRPGRPVCRQLAILRFLCFRGGGENKFEKHKRAFFFSFHNSRINSKGTKPYPYFLRHLGEVSN